MPTPTPRAESLASFWPIRDLTVALCEPLAIEDHVVQSMADVSPPKWHLGHTTWFFETQLLRRFRPGYEPVHPSYDYLFNSYYNTLGPMQPRNRRGLLSRPPVAAVHEYRRLVDERVAEFVETASAETWAEAATILELGMHHEQQHQELLLMDIKHILFSNALDVAYRDDLPRSRIAAPPLGFVEFPGAVHEFGHAGHGFAFDNEQPCHPELVGAFAIADRCVTNGEFLEFIDDDGYRRPELWLADGWDLVEREGWQAPLYWIRRGEEWSQFTLSGRARLVLGEPVVHVSHFEADAFARWCGKRLPSEFEWELAARTVAVDGNLLESGRLHPQPAGADGGSGLAQLFGDVWELTRSPYAPYPGYRPFAGALAEYNGKFMCNQFVLRGGSCATPRSHIRATYRNFFYPHQRWSFQGFRLAEDR